MIVIGLFQEHGGGYPKLSNLDPTFALVLLGMLKFEELRAALDVVQIRMGEGDYVKVIPIGLVQFILEAGLQVDHWGVSVFRVFSAMAEVEQNTAALGKDDLGRVPIAYRVENHFMNVCHGILLMQGR
jgi:hypothetical protein